MFNNIDEVKERFRDMQVEATRKMKEIERAIERLPSEDERAVLVMRYMERKSFKEIAKRLPLSERSVYNYHQKALEHIRMPEEGVEVYRISW